MRAEPKSYQADAVDHHISVVDRIGASAEGSVPGFGKTFVAAFVARETGHELCVVCPRVVIPHWQRAAEAAGAKVLCVSNYEQHKLGNTGLGKWERQPSRRRKAGRVTKTFGGRWRWTFTRPTLLVFDEAHYFKSRASMNAKLALAAHLQKIPTLVMSATLAVDPLDLYATGRLLGLHSDDFEWKSFCYAHGCLDIGFEMKFCPRHDPTALTRLNAALWPSRGHRKTYAEIPGFPEATDDVREVAAKPEALEKMEKAWARAAELTELERDSEIAVTARLRARQLAELAKVPAIVELAKDLTDSGLSVPIFLNFKDSIDAVSAALCCPTIDGRVSDRDREAAIQAFQADDVREIAIQTDAGGVGISLHDTRGKHPRHSILSPGDNARSLVQALGRNRRVGQVTPAFRTILTLENSIERKVYRALSAKVGQLDTINDGDLDPL